MNLYRPPHQKTKQLPEELPGNYLEDFFEDLGGWFPSPEAAARYHDGMTTAYHHDRLRALQALTRQVKKTKDSDFDVLDFGIGDGREVLKLGVSIGRLTGIDISPHMISLARENVEHKNSELIVGGAEVLTKFEANSIDIVVSTNVLGYLSPEVEEIFFEEAVRILRPGGWILLSLGNELFDLFALNSGTVSFFESQFQVSGAENLLVHGNSRKLVNARRHNPLSLEAALGQYGLSKIGYSFSQWHTKPPIIEEVVGAKSPNEARLGSRDHDFDANGLPPRDQWRALFQCSIFGALFQK